MCDAPIKSRGGAPCGRAVKTAGGHCGMHAHLDGSARVRDEPPSNSGTNILPKKPKHVTASNEAKTDDSKFDMQEFEKRCTESVFAALQAAETASLAREPASDEQVMAALAPKQNLQEEKEEKNTKPPQPTPGMTTSSISAGNHDSVNSTKAKVDSSQVSPGLEKTAPRESSRELEIPSKPSGGISASSQSAVADPIPQAQPAGSSTDSYSPYERSLLEAASAAHRRMPQAIIDPRMYQNIQAFNRAFGTSVSLAPQFRTQVPPPQKKPNIRYV